jgi:peroxiredoxin
MHLKQKIMKSIVTVFLCSLFAFNVHAQNSNMPAGVPTGLKAGDKAPMFMTMDADGKKVSLEEMLKKGAVVVQFYRGQWCPYCNKQLSQMNDSMQMIKDKGANVVFVTPETKEGVGKTKMKTKTSFPIISDSGMAIMKAYKVNFMLDEATVTKYKGYGIDLNMANGGNGNNLPVPATYVIGKDGIIKYVYFNMNYAQRATVKDILAAL